MATHSLTQTESARREHSTAHLAVADRVRPLLEEHRRLVVLIKEAEEAEDEERLIPLVVQVTQLVFGGAAMIPQSLAEARTQLELIIEGKRDHALKFGDGRQMPPLDRIIDMLKASGTGGNRIEPLYSEWQRLEARRPTPTDDEADALTDVQSDLVAAAVDIMPADLGELRSQMEFVHATGRGGMDPYDWAAYPAIKNAVTFLREVAS